MESFIPEMKCFLNATNKMTVGKEVKITPVRMSG